ncbi:MAG: TrkH family potassium uptake protein [Vicinamibacteria bacterium]|nr:TrkH family potassium uptake protein [Vicinamibacteria bacterium]
MIRYAGVAHVLGQFLLALAATLLFPLGWALAFGQAGATHFALSALVTALAALALVTGLERPARDLDQREGLLLVIATWFAVAAFGGLPFYFSPAFSGLTDAFFEAASGFTTTGATVLADVEVLPEPLQLWRCFTHWLGGMGVVLLGIAILPLVGHGGMQLYRAEFSGAKSEKLKPRIAETAVSLWKLYFALTVAQVVALRWAGLSTFEALCHAFSTLGTGGFSTRTASVAGFRSPLVEYIIVVFMLLAGASFIQHYRLWVERRPRAVWADFEVRGYMLIAGGATALVAFVLAVGERYSPEHAFRAALFQVSSILTTTGFVTEDFEAWHPLPQGLLLALMFVGGCTGSTAGGLKVSRLVLLARVVSREFKRMVEPRGVFAVRLGGQVVAERTIQSLLNLVYLAFVVFWASALVLTALGVDVLTSISAVAASMFNIGPGLGAVGPLDNYGHLPALGKWVLALCMIAGRLEFYTLLVILSPAFWRR